MKIFVPKEVRDGEQRVAITPGIATQLIKAGFSVEIQTGAGLAAGFTDASYTAAGVSLCNSAEVPKDAGLVVKINPPTSAEVAAYPSNITLISLLYHLVNTDLIASLNAKNITAFSLDAIPRISRAQSMDVLSSQANLAGYKAVILGANHLTRIFPLLMTAAGTVTPSKVLIFGVGVAGLQAIATAKRLGAVVEATDVRPETKEQVESLGGKFIEVKGAEVGSEGGYAKEATEEYRQKQREAVNKSLAAADLIITTALVPGRKAPILLDDEQMGMLKTGAVVIDMAAEQGGNTTKTKANEIVEFNGAKIVGAVNLASDLANNASELFARNIQELLKLIAPKGEMAVDKEDEIVKGCMVASPSNAAQA